MENFRNEWEAKLENLLTELLVSENAYRKSALMNKYPERSAFFKSQESQREEFASVLAEELNTINNERVRSRNLIEDTIYETVAHIALQENMTLVELDRMILNKEKALVGKYQYVLADKGIPDTTDAILQAQAEAINEGLQQQQLELNIE